MTKSIGNRGVIDDLPTTLEISDTGRAASTGDCNRYFGAVTIDGDRIVFKQLASTRKACPPAIINQEARFHRALRRARSWRIEHEKLLLFDQTGAIVIRLSKVE